MWLPGPMQSLLVLESYAGRSLMCLLALPVNEVHGSALERCVGSAVSVSLLLPSPPAGCGGRATCPLDGATACYCSCSSSRVWWVSSFSRNPMLRSTGRPGRHSTRFPCPVRPRPGGRGGPRRSPVLLVLARRPLPRWPWPAARWCASALAPGAGRPPRPEPWPGRRGPWPGGSAACWIIGSLGCLPLVVLESARFPCRAFPGS